MKRKILFSVCLLALVPLTSRSEYLYWMLDDTVNNLSGNSDFKYATIGVNGTDVVFQENTMPERGLSEYVTVSVSEAGKPHTERGWYADITGYGAKDSVFLLELYDENLDRKAWTTITLTDEIIDKHVYTEAGGPVPTEFNAWGSVVPEPTSGLLTLCGLALLALRRKRILV